MTDKKYRWAGLCLGCAFITLGGCMMTGGGGMMPTETCDAEADCALGESCTDGVCVATSDADLQYLVLLNGQTAAVADGGDIPVFRGVQGGIHTLLTLRAVGIPTMAVTDSVIEFTLASTGAAAGPIAVPNLFFSDLDGGVGEAVDVFVTLDLSADIVGQDGLVTITVTSQDDPPVTATLVQRIRFIDGGVG